MSEWINVKDRLPDWSRRVLTLSLSGKTQVYFFVFTTRKFIDDNDNDHTESITHWVEIPEIIPLDK